MRWMSLRGSLRGGMSDWGSVEEQENKFRQNCIYVTMYDVLVILHSISAEKSYHDQVTACLAPI